MTTFTEHTVELKGSRVHPWCIYRVPHGSYYVIEDVMI